MEIKTVALVVHNGKPSAVELATTLSSYLSGRGVAVSEESADLVVSVGGDGTMLRAAQLAHSLDAPLLGVNMGALGYLNEVDGPHAKGALDRVFEGAFKIEERMMLDCEVRDGEITEHFVGLNEVLVDRSGRHRLVRLQVSIGGESLAAFSADGVIVATPTGSTAYALSAGGPIVAPGARCIVLAPVSAHLVFARPFVLGDEETVEVTVDRAEEGASVSLDGAIGRDVSAGAVITIRRHERPLRLVRLEGPGFIERLRVKLDLPV